MQSDLCVLLATYNRPNLCERSVRSLIAALAQIPELNANILIGVNGPDSTTSSLLQAIVRELPAEKLRIVHFADRLTPSACRNRLLESVQSHWVYFVDDDAYVDSDFFKLWKKSPLVSHCAAIGGPNLNPPKSGFFQRVASHVLASPFATYFSSSRYQADGPARTCSEESLILCNLFVKHEALPRSAFPDDLQCAEENWLLQNLKNGQHELGYDPSLAVWHERRPGLFSFARQVFKYGFGRGQIFRRRPNGIHAAHLLPGACVLYTCGIFVTGSAGWWLLPFPIYVGLCLLFALRGSSENSWIVRLAGAPLFPVIHVAYATGLAWGVVRG